MAIPPFPIYERSGSSQAAEGVVLLEPPLCQNKGKRYGVVCGSLELHDEAVPLNVAPLPLNLSGL